MLTLNLSIPYQTIHHLECNKKLGRNLPEQGMHGKESLYVCCPSIFSMVQSLNYTVTMGDSKQPKLPEYKVNWSIKCRILAYLQCYTFGSGTMDSTGFFLYVQPLCIQHFVYKLISCLVHTVSFQSIYTSYNLYCSFYNVAKARIVSSNQI